MKNFNSPILYVGSCILGHDIVPYANSHMWRHYSWPQPHDGIDKHHPDKYTKIMKFKTMKMSSSTPSLWMAVWNINLEMQNCPWKCKIPQQHSFIIFTAWKSSCVLVTFTIHSNHLHVRFYETVARKCYKGSLRTLSRTSFINNLYEECQILFIIMSWQNTQTRR